MDQVKQLSMAELETGLEQVLASPQDGGVLQMIVRRPAVDQREMVEQGALSLAEGLVGDNWSGRKNVHPEAQLTIMNTRLVNLVAQDRARWSLAGDQLYLDMDISEENMPAGTQLSLGSAVVEVTALPHTGCKKFVARFGLDAMQFVNSSQGKKLRLRGLNAKVVQPGVVQVGDMVYKL